MAKTYEFDGRRMTVRAWARELGLTYQGLYGRLAKWSIEQALGLPRRPERPEARAARRSARRLRETREMILGGARPGHAVYRS